MKWLSHVYFKYIFFIKLVSSSPSEVVAKHETPKKHCVDDLKFSLNVLSAGKCEAHVRAHDLSFKINIIFPHIGHLQYLTNRLHFAVCVYCSRSQMTSQDVKNKNVRHETKSSGVTVVLYTLWRLLWSITVHTNVFILYNCNLFVLYNKNSYGHGLLKDLGGMKIEKQVC